LKLCALLLQECVEVICFVDITVEASDIDWHSICQCQSRKDAENNKLQ